MLSQTSKHVFLIYTEYLKLHISCRISRNDTTKFFRPKSIYNENLLLFRGFYRSVQRIHIKTIKTSKLNKKQNKKLIKAEHLICSQTYLW